MKRNIESKNRTSAKFALVSALTLALSANLFAWNISGQVKSGSTPLSGVTVTVQDSSKYSTTTDANGNFSFQTSGILGRDGATPFFS
ncbi:MAG: carboxypeptidase regulatory-like domain-containing protein, partial [Fibrobacterota bacterium]